MSVITDTKQLFYRIASSGYMPASWFRPPLPAIDSKQSASQPVSMEIVSHCWNYSNLLTYQLSSLVLNPPTNHHLTYTLFYCEEDEPTAALVSFFKQKFVETITWNFHTLDKYQMFRRAIGRNQAALASKADWLWFVDCDLIFGENCLNELGNQLVGANDYLVYPSNEQITELLPEEHSLFHPKNIFQINAVDPSIFYTGSIEKAKGAFQIVNGNIARVLGYCNSVKFYQQPAERWQKTYEDKVFRWLLGTEGRPVSFPNLSRIRHQHKGRYQQNSIISRLRKAIRLAQG